ncbi:coiled-coil domain-containing protein 89-like [Tubulanus polymorphus]|uniref:coiled-coil domain-containing protein 89-like n=1 Tax=Tubulanus polymorphus TaxID=672921 RepID=UPI003DA688CD
MASSQRNPRELRQMVENSHNDVNEMQANLEKLRNLASDDKTENAMLRGRIDEQSELIMILKNRSDENIVRSQALEKLNADQERQLREATDALALETMKFRMLEDRFGVLAENHEEMIRIKDEYKRLNEELRRRNEKLKSDNEGLFSEAIVERDEKIGALQTELSRLKTRYADLDSQYKKIEAEYSTTKAVFDGKWKQQEKNHEKSVSDLRKQLKTAEQELKVTRNRLEAERTNKQSMDDDSAKKLQQITREKDELLDLCMNRGKIIQDKQTENKKLLSKIEEMEKLVKEMELKFEREAAAVNSNVAVRKMRQDVEEAEKKYNSIVQEYNAYKKHTNSLIQKERDLNAKLRHLMG